jgi:hypothetical protein
MLPDFVPTLCPLHKSVATAAVPDCNPISAHVAVIGAVVEAFPTFKRSTTTSPPASGPAHTCIGSETFTAGGGGCGVGGGCTPPLVARHMGMFIAATRFEEPIGGAQLVKLDENWLWPLRYQSWSDRELKRHVDCVQFFPT